MAKKLSKKEIRERREQIHKASLIDFLNTKSGHTWKDGLEPLGMIVGPLKDTPQEALDALAERINYDNNKCHRILNADVHVASGTPAKYYCTGEGYSFGD